MAILNSDPETQQKLAVAVPLLAVIVSLVIVLPAWGRNAELTSQLIRDKNELQTLRSSPPPAFGGVEPAAEARPDEAARFQTEVRSMAAKAGCALTGYDMLQTQVSEAAKESTAGQSTDPNAAGGGGIKPYRVRVDVQGSYKQVRSLLWQITHARRLYVITELIVFLERRSGAAVEPLSTTVGIERYVALSPAPGASTGGANPK